jgi:hypothetical protein
MKSKKFDKKLMLKKKTVVNLKSHDMKGIYGGADTEVWCPTGFTYCVTGCISECPRCTVIATCPCY